MVEELTGGYHDAPTRPSAAVHSQTDAWRDVVSWRCSPDADAALVGDPQASGEWFLFEQPNHASHQAEHRRLILARWAQDHDASVLARRIGSKIGEADVEGQDRASFGARNVRHYRIRRASE
jgi:hypothetical protein